jgi:hypothetical protein
VTVPADQVENGEPLSLQTTASPSIRHERTGSTVNAGDDLREAACEVNALPGEQPAPHERGHRRPTQGL